MPCRDTQGAAAARGLYRQLMRGPAPGGDFFRAIIKLEQEEGNTELPVPSASATYTSTSAGSSSSGGSSTGKSTELLTELHEAALSAYGESEADLWLSYALYEMQQMRGAGTIMWRATKALQDPTGFLNMYREAVAQDDMQ